LDVLVFNGFGCVTNFDVHVISESVQTGRGDSVERNGVVSGEEGGSVSVSGVSVEVPDVVAVSCVMFGGDGVSVQDGNVRSIWNDDVDAGESLVVGGQEGKGGGV